MESPTAVQRATHVGPGAAIADADEGGTQVRHQHEGALQGERSHRHTVRYTVHTVAHSTCTLWH